MTIPVYVPGITINDNGNLVLDADEMDAAGVGVVEFVEVVGGPTEAEIKMAQKHGWRYWFDNYQEMLNANVANIRLLQQAEGRIKTLEAANASWKRYHDAGSAAYERAEKAEADAGRLKEANTRMHEDIEALENVADLRRIALEQVEYHQAYTLSCPWCFSLQESGHKPDCARQAALSPATTTTRADSSAYGTDCGTGEAHRYCSPSRRKRGRMNIQETEREAATRIAELEARLKDAEEDKLRITKLEAELREAAELLEKRIGYGVGLQCVAEGVRVVIRDLTAAEARVEAAEKKFKDEREHSEWLQGECNKAVDDMEEANSRAEKAEAEAERLRRLIAKAQPIIEAHYEEYYQGAGVDIRPEIAAALSPAATDEQQGSEGKE